MVKLRILAGVQCVGVYRASSEKRFMEERPNYGPNGLNAALSAFYSARRTGSNGGDRE